MSLLNPFEKRGPVYIKNMTAQDLAAEPLPNDRLHYVKVELGYEGFNHHIFFSRSQRPHEGIVGPHVALMQKGKHRTLAEMKELGPQTFEKVEFPNLEVVVDALGIPVDKTKLPFDISNFALLQYTGPSPIYTDIEVHERVADILERVIGAGPSFYKFTDQKTGKSKDTQSDAEIYSAIDLHNGFFRKPGTLTQEEISECLLAIQDSSEFESVSLSDAHYIWVRQRDFRKMDPSIKAKANFMVSKEPPRFIQLY